jgi:asparagine synthase (glutamine-hydrolysing)
MHFKGNKESVCTLCFNNDIWHKSSTSSVISCYAGFAYIPNNNYLFDNANENMSDFFNIDNLSDQLKEKIQNIKGHYSFVMETQDYVLAVVDRVRSYPIYYAETNGVLILSSETDIKGELHLNNVDTESLLEFEMSGYVAGRKTLHKKVYQMLPGEYLLYEKKSKKLHRERYYQYGLGDYNLSQKTEDELLKELHQLHLKVFSEMVNSLNGRPVWIPLSGGLDSRFILAMLKELNYENITTFSYGPNEFWEIKNAEKIAKFLNVKWHHVEYNSKQIRKFFDTKNRKEYYKYAWGMNTVPVLNDYYAILMMKENGIIPDDAVFINGQSGDFLTGGHIPDLENINYETSLLIEKIIDKNYSLWQHLKVEGNLKHITDMILSEVNLSSEAKISATDVARYYEFYEWQERQCKLVINGQRVYEHFGFDWYLPLWNDDLMFFWERVPWQIKCKQKLFKKYLTVYDSASVFNRDWNVPRYNYQHTPFILRVLTSLSRFLFPKYNFQQNFTEYYSTYSAFYPQNSYWQYLKESKGHRNAVSFHAKLIADGLKNR